MVFIVIISTPTTINFYPDPFSPTYFMYFSTSFDRVIHFGNLVVPMYHIFSTILTPYIKSRINVTFSIEHNVRMEYTIT